jgi:hypothetical protein
MARRAASLALTLALVLAPVSAFGQTGTGAITINIVDTSTGKPLDDARVFLTGTMIVSALTQKSGTVKYTDVPTGIYRVHVMRRGYDGAHSNEFEVLDGKDVTVKFALSPSQQIVIGPNGERLRVIGTVTVKSNVQINTNDISDESPIRRISDSMLDALDKLAGVSVNQDTNDPDSAVTISLNGHDESQTSMTLDGIPLSVPGSAMNLRGVNSDLFSGASVSFAPTAAGLGGGVNFRTLEPTQSWNEHLSSTYGTYDRWNYQVSATGSIGPLGIAVMHTARGGNNPLTFRDYEDASGLTYPHAGFSDNLGDFVKLRYRIADAATLTGTFMSSNGSIAQICTQWVTTLPCGIGPGNDTYNKFQFGYLTASSLVGNVAFTATAFGMASRNLVDDLNEVIAGTPNPFETENQGHTNGYAFTASVGHNKHTFSLSGNIFSSTHDFTPLTPSPYVVQSAIGINAHQLNLADTIKSTDKLNLNFNGSLADTTGIGYSVLGGGGATWRPTGNDTYQIALALGSAQPPPTIPRTFSNPVNARFNCDAGTAIVSGPGDSGTQQQSSVSYNFDWTHLWRTGQITVNAFRQTQIGQTINALINSAGEPADYFPPGYVSAIDATWSQPTICGAMPFNPSGVYVTEPIAGTARVYQGFDVSGRIALGPNVVMLPTYALNSAVLVAADSRLTAADSTTIIGAQLPGRPIHRAGITFDGQLPRSGIELLANAQYTGANNNRHLTPYTTVNWGVSHALGQGRLTLFETNAFSAVSGEFSTLEYAEPVPVSGGGVVFFAANPLLPRTISLNYTVNVGKGARPAGSSLQQQARFAARGGDRGPGGGPGGEGGPRVFGPGGPGGPRGGPFQIRRNVLPPGGDPFALATDNPMCNAEAQKVARPLLGRLHAYVTAYEQKTTLPETPDYAITAHTTAAGSAVPYWLEIRPKGFGPAGRRGPGENRAFGGGRSDQNIAISGAPVITPSPVPSSSASPRPEPQRRGEGPQRFRAVFACEYITLLTAEQAKEKGIETNGRVFMGYAPGVGIFGVLPRQLPQGGGSLRGQ